ncbi:MAG: cation transporter, partial [Erysipelotrichaceae bacterium]|nr:cation transporter [Erysipelotrichaceae bacterium]
KIKSKMSNKTKKEKRNMEKTLKIEGMMCGHCEMHVKKALEAIDGVKKAEVSHTNATAVLTLEKEVSDDVLKEAVANQGYKVTDIK